MPLSKEPSARSLPVAPYWSELPRDTRPPEDPFPWNVVLRWMVPGMGMMIMLIIAALLAPL
jgi:hypothetical protein